MLGEQIAIALFDGQLFGNVFASGWARATSSARYQTHTSGDRESLIENGKTSTSSGMERSRSRSLRRADQGQRQRRQ